MSELDFQKIFASGASSQIDWTDDNYLKGWGYLGNVPPSYQSFDSLQRLNDLKFKYLYDEFMGIETNTEELISNHNENSEAHKTLFDKKLDKNGGTVTGSLGVQDVLMVQKQTEEQPKVAIDDGRHRVDFIIDTNGEARFLNESQEFVSLYAKDLHGTADKAVADKNGREIDTGYLKTDGGTLKGSLGVQDVLMVQKQTAQPKLTLDDGSHRADFILDVNSEVQLLNESQEPVSLTVADLHGTADKAVADKNGREIDTGYLKTDGGTLKGSLGVQDVLMVQKQAAQPKINLSDGTHTLNIILDENGDVRFLDNNGRTLNIFVKQVIQG